MPPPPAFLLCSSPAQATDPESTCLPNVQHVPAQWLTLKHIWPKAGPASAALAVGCNVCLDCEGATAVQLVMTPAAVHRPPRLGTTSGLAPAPCMMLPVMKSHACKEVGERGQHNGCQKSCAK